MAEQWAMILAAGRGQRMGELTQSRPKPLVEVGGKPLIQHQIERLLQAGIRHFVINTAYLGSQIEAFLGDGQRFGANIRYSHEQEGLETGGGLFKALPLLASDPFVVVNSDILFAQNYNLASGGFKHTNSLAKLVLVPNPDFKSTGDFSVDEKGCLIDGQDYTFSGLSLMTAQFVREYAPEEALNSDKPLKFALAPMLRQAISDGVVEAEVSDALWLDVGTPDRLLQANKAMMSVQQK